jgi:LPS sulfotransferase NodH
MNGIFGAKVMWGHLHDFLELHTGDGSLASSHRIDASLRDIFPNLKYIYVTRQSKLRQAVSLWIALQTQRWRLDPSILPTETVREPIFHFEAIDFLRRQLIEQDAAWRRFFTEAGIAPLMLDYEQFSLDLPHALVRVVDLLEIGCEPFDCFVQPPLAKQADRRSEEFVRMYESSLHGPTNPPARPTTLPPRL